MVISYAMVRQKYNFVEIASFFIERTT